MWVERNGKTWRIRDEVGGRKVDLLAGYPTKDSARSAMTLLMADALRGDALVPRGGRLLLDEFLDDWWPDHLRALKPSAQRSESGRMDNHVRPLLGQIALDELDSATVQRWIRALQDGDGPWRGRGKRRPLAPKSVANVHGLLFTAMRAAVSRRLIRANPCVGTDLPLRVHREMRFLTDPEIGRLLTAVPGHWKTLVTLLVGTGLRWGEAIGLKAGRVDLLAAKPKLLVVEHLHELSGTGELVWTSPKSERSRRTVSLTRQVAVALAGQVAGKEPDEPVFTAPQGGLVRTRNFRRGWVRWTAAAGLDGLRIHDLRHTHAAILISAGRPLSAISRRLGHSSIGVTDALYGHIREEADDGILDAIDSALSHVEAAEVLAEL